MSEDARDSSNQTDGNMLVNREKALQKLAEIPLIDCCIDDYKKYMKDLRTKWIGRIYSKHTIKPKKEQEILNRLIGEKKKRKKLVARLRDVVQNQIAFTTTDEAYSTDTRFLDDHQNPATKCNYCPTEDVSQILCYCEVCKTLICVSCVVEHRMNNKNHKYLYQSQILCEYGESDSWTDRSMIYDIKCMRAGLVMVLHTGKLCTYDMTGRLKSTHPFRRFIGSCSRIACVDDCTIAVTVPLNDEIHVVTITAPTETNDLRNPARTKMTGGITCRMKKLFVAFSDAIRLMDLSGQIQKVIEIPNVNIIHSVNNDKMLFVYSERSDKTMSCLDLTNDNVSDFESFPFYPTDVTTDDVGNIVFIADGVIWQANSDGRNLKIIISKECSKPHFKLTYDKDSKILLTRLAFWHEHVKVYRKLE